MNAEPFLAEIARHLEALHFDVVLIGNPAAALHGAPVTAVDFDFMFRRTPANVRKLKSLASALGATILRPYYPASDLFRVVRDDDGLQLDFMATVHGGAILRGPADARVGGANRPRVAARGGAGGYHQEQAGGAEARKRPRAR